MSMPGLGEELAAEGREDDLRATIARLSRQLDRAHARRDELVEAVYRAAHDAAQGLTIPPVPAPAPDRRKATGEVAVVVLGDWQLAKVTPSYSSDVCEERIERLGDKVERIVSLHRSASPVRSAHLFVLGDLVEGELIFPGQAHRIDASLYRQAVDRGPRILANFTRRMLGLFPDGVTLDAVDGNHGAIGGPFRRDYHPESNADRMLYRVVQMLLEPERRLTWNFPDPDGERNWFAVAKIGAYTSLLMHGDQFRGTAGMPWYSIQKKAGGWALGAIEEFALRLGETGETDIDFGHWHQPTRLTLNRVTARCNGSTESHNTWAQEQLAAVGRPSQSLRFVEPARGRVTAEYVLYLD